MNQLKEEYEAFKQLEQRNKESNHEKKIKSIKIRNEVLNIIDKVSKSNTKTLQQELLNVYNQLTYLTDENNSIIEDSSSTTNAKSSSKYSNNTGNTSISQTPSHYKNSNSGGYSNITPSYPATQSNSASKSHNKSDKSPDVNKNFTKPYSSIPTQQPNQFNPIVASTQITTTNNVTCSPKREKLNNMNITPINPTNNNINNNNNQDYKNIVSIEGEITKNKINNNQYSYATNPTKFVNPSSYLHQDNITKTTDDYKKKIVDNSNEPKKYNFRRIEDITSSNNNIISNNNLINKSPIQQQQSQENPKPINSNYSSYFNKFVNK